MACFGNIPLFQLVDSSGDDRWQATKPPSVICIVSINMQEDGMLWQHPPHVIGGGR